MNDLIVSELRLNHQGDGWIRYRQEACQEKRDVAVMWFPVIIETI
jgi:hypothetical protein